MSTFSLQTVIRLRRRRHDSGGFMLTVRRGLAWPLQKAGTLAHVLLSKALLLSCEVALEYMLGLTYSPQVCCQPMCAQMSPNMRLRTRSSAE